jgi:hypothetical protein
MAPLLSTRAIFQGVKACKNEAYCHLLFKVDEVYKDNILSASLFQEPNMKILMNAERFDQYSELEVNNEYWIQVEPKLQPAKDKYSASVSYSLHKASPVPAKQ